ncbi:MAG: excinuclease ABC subunit C [Flavobacteriales bacterium]|nr:MAG: excinuclease ABC subunit C [Flavobacteriales bacterium]
MERGGAVYIITNKYNKVLYTGVTSNLKNRIFEHQEKLNSNSFSAKYNLKKLVYYKGFQHIEEAIAEEKRIKGGSRKKKIQLIESINPKWTDLTNTL